MAEDDSNNTDKAQMMRALRAATAEFLPDKANAAILIVDWGKTMSLIAGLSPDCPEEALSNLIDAAPSMVQEWAESASEDAPTKQPGTTTLWN